MSLRPDEEESAATPHRAQLGRDAGGFGDLPLLFSTATAADIAIAALIGLYLAGVVAMPEPGTLPAADAVVAVVLPAIGLAACGV